MRFRAAIAKAVAAVGAAAMGTVVGALGTLGVPARADPPEPPQHPTAVTADPVPGVGVLSINWDQSADTTDYTVLVTDDPGGANYGPVAAGSCAGTPSAPPCTISGLTPGT